MSWTLVIGIGLVFLSGSITGVWIGAWWHRRTLTELHEWQNGQRFLAGGRGIEGITYL